MPLIIVCGHPCIGKTLFAEELKSHLESRHSCSVVLVNEESLGISCIAGYGTSLAEKTSRASIKSAVDHSLSSGTWVIVDSMNYIKGFRYELHCLARSMKSSQCCLWLSCDEGKSDQWNKARKENTGNAYPQDILIDLRRRFEPPNERNRWDRPLFCARTDAEIMTPDVKINECDCNIEQLSVRVTPPIPVSGSSEVSTSSPVQSIHQNSTILQSETSLAPAHQDNDKEQAITSSFRRKGKVSSNSSVSANSTFIRTTERKGASGDNGDALVFNRLDAIAFTAAGSKGAKRGKDVNNQTVNSAVPIVGEICDIVNARVQLFDRIYAELSLGPVAQPNSSTVSVPHGSADLLYELDYISQQIAHAIAAHQSGPDKQEGTPLKLPAYDRCLELHRTVGLAELQRHRTQFVRLNSKHPPADATQAGAMFVDFLALNL